MAKRKKGRAREHGASVPLSFEIDPKLDGALEQCAQSDLRTKKAIITLALQAYLRERGFWPPAEGEQA